MRPSVLLSAVTRRSSLLVSTCLLGAAVGLVCSVMPAGCMFDLPDVRPVDASVSGMDGGPVLEGGEENDAVACEPDCSGKCKGDPDGCGGQCTLDDCPPGQVCDSNGACCTPSRSCESEEVHCGSIDDGCGHTISCGTCSGRSDYCLQGECRKVDIELQRVPRGEFLMGSPTNEPGRNQATGGGLLDETQHQVRLTHDFYISSKEVTQKVYRLIMGYNPSNFFHCGENCPVENVSWDEAAWFCNALSVAKDLPPCFVCSGDIKQPDTVHCTLSGSWNSPYECPGFRLPTEAEWEYAARALSETALYKGPISEPACEPMDGTLNSIGWYRGNADVSYQGGVRVSCGASTKVVGTHEVGQMSANYFGLCDVAGNVWEWTLDCPSNYPRVSVTDPYSRGGNSCSNADRVTRGGSIFSEAVLCRHAERFRGTSTHAKRASDVGFRVVRTVQ